MAVPTIVRPMCALRSAFSEISTARKSEKACSGLKLGWLPFLDTYRTMCRAPEPAFRQILEDVRELRFAA
jgi:hypothetical protein